MQNVIEINDLRKQYPGFLMQDITFSLPQGFVMGLIGPNGSGKTTLIKLIMNLVHRDAGSVKIFGLDASEDRVEIKKRIGFVYDNPGYYDHLTLKQLRNIVAPFYENWDEEVFRSLVKQFDLPLRKTISKFSRGMVMKSAIAIALSHHADLIVMDEPTSGLDPVFRRELLELLYKELQNEKKSILFSTHITSDLEIIADYLTFILDGRLVFSEEKDSITEKYAIVKGGNGALTNDDLHLFKGFHNTGYGFEALTDNLEEVKKRYGKEVTIEKASLEDIMVFTKIRGHDVVSD